MTKEKLFEIIAFAEASGFIINGEEINKHIIEELIDVTSKSDLKITHKISLENINVRGAARQKVKLATKLFSRTISMALSRCGSMGILKQGNWPECAEFFNLVNEWFDIMNVKVPTSDSRDRTKAYGLALDLQNRIIEEMTK
ncbi:hypothetical protein NQ318_003129 [Aromia moschata]|uniref:Transposable element P transposase-like GTP-binding insertion domain-containing protein n=1 Tax=Aromia moschata TaxID=1265417 RepID=A0AAV8YSF7_9CUCU|nr:hypothetical protein NQ318_003129 [Aromia moschata]